MHHSSFIFLADVYLNFFFMKLDVSQMYLEYATKLETVENMSMEYDNTKFFVNKSCLRIYIIGKIGAMYTNMKKGMKSVETCASVETYVYCLGTACKGMVISISKQPTNYLSCIFIPMA